MTVIVRLLCLLGLFLVALCWTLLAFLWVLDNAFPFGPRLAEDEEVMEAQRETVWRTRFFFHGLLYGREP